MNPRDTLLKDIKSLYALHKAEIIRRIGEFDRVGREGCDGELFRELVFCLLTPQSRAVYCWEATLRLEDKGLLLNGTASVISHQLKRVRFHNTKAERIVEARKQFARNGELTLRDSLERFDNSTECREWLVENVKGLGYKEASHFLRNTGRGEDLSILDRHILKNLALLGVIDDVPKTMTRKRYIEIENAMGTFARRIRIPMSHLDLVFWCKEAGEVFK
ncbi:N-glycosylase/DNA lyase [Candidatus Hydrogenedentota bacterium]